MSYLAEKSVIGSLLINKECMTEIYNILKPQMFTSELLGKVYHEYQRAYDRGYDLTLPMIEQNLRSDSFPSDLIMAELKECLSEIFTTSEIRQNALVVENDYKAEKLNQILNSIKVSPNDLKLQIGALQKELEALQNGRELASKSLSEIVLEN